jgi:hypothetical protein
MEERTRRARELILKVRGLLLSLPFLDPPVTETSFLRDHLDLQDVAVDRAWLVSESTLFLWFGSTTDRLQALRTKIILDEDLARS